MINWFAVLIAVALGAFFALVMPLWGSIPAAAGLGVVLCHFLPPPRRHHRHRGYR